MQFFRSLGFLLLALPFFALLDFFQNDAFPPRLVPDWGGDVGSLYFFYVLLLSSTDVSPRLFRPILCLNPPHVSSDLPSKHSGGLTSLYS